MSDERSDVWLELFAGAAARRLRRGEVLFRLGERAEHVFRVRTGAVRLERVAADGSPVAIGVARPSDTVGEAALFAVEYHCDARAEVATVVESARAELLRERLRSDAALAVRVIGNLTRQLRDVRAMLELRSSHSARERVLRYFALFGSVAALGDVSLQTLAHQIGMRPETLYRTLARLEESGLVERHGRQLRLASSTAAAAGTRRRRRSQRS